MNRTRTVSAKVTPDEQQTLRTRAASLGIKPGDYYRQALLAHQDLSNGDIARLICVETRIIRELLREAQEGTNIAAIRERITREAFVLADELLEVRLALLRSADNGGNEPE